MKEAQRFHLDLRTGVPVYRQIIDQVLGGIAAGAFKTGDQLPTVRQLAVDLSVNPNTVVRAYRELEIRGLARKVKQTDAERTRRLNQIVSELMARAGAEGFTVSELMERLVDLQGKEKSNA
jgi:GntR family transcriptional regulator